MLFTNIEGLLIYVTPILKYVNRCNRIDSYILKLGVTAAFFVLNAINHCIENYFKQKSPLLPEIILLSREYTFAL